MPSQPKRSRRKLTEYNKFVADMIKCHGMTLKQAAKAWKGDKRTKKTRSKAKHKKSCRLVHRSHRKTTRKVGSRSIKRSRSKRSR